MTDHLVPCEGGPPGTAGWRRVPDPPPLEIESDDGIFVLDDSHDGLRYVFVVT